MSVRKAIGAMLAIAGMALAVTGAIGLANQERAAEAYDDLATEVTIENDGSEEGDPGIDWAALLATNPTIVAWCHIEGTDIDLPVCQATDDDPEHWLTHDLWDDESPAGTPYVDHRATTDSQHVLCYGHHLTGTGGMFSELYLCHEQAEFDRILAGDLIWSTPDGRTLHLRPLCASVVDKDDADIQHFDFVNDTDFHLWLKEIPTSSSARNSSATTLVASATRAITLVTCSSDLSGRPERTIVTFAT